MIKYVDTFCGMGGFSVAVKQLLPDSTCVLAIDYDKNVANTFKENFGIECLGNIRELDTDNIPDHDILFGGFPCQPFSRNGKWFNKNDKTVGDDEERDNLFLELVRILSNKKPKYFIFENVKGLLSMKNKDGTMCLQTIIDNLTDCGYNVLHKVLDAADHGLPQQRHRVFFVGIRKDLNQNFVWPKNIVRKSSIQDILEINAPDKYLLKNLWKNREINLSAKEENLDKKNHPFNKGHSRYEVIQYLYNSASKPEKSTGKIESVAILYGDTPSGLPRQQDKVYSIKGISPTIATFSTPSIDAIEGLRQLTPRECARLQGFPDSYILPSNDALAYKQIGNAVAPPVVLYILKQLFGSQDIENKEV